MVQVVEILHHGWQGPSLEISLQRLISMIYAICLVYYNMYLKSEYSLGKSANLNLGLSSDLLSIQASSSATLKKNVQNILTHWGSVTHICVVKQNIIGSDNGLSPGQRQAIIWTNAGILLIGPLGTNFSEILIGIQTFSFKKMHWKMSSGKWRPSCLGLNVLRWLMTVMITIDSLWLSDILVNIISADGSLLVWNHVDLSSMGPLGIYSNEI